MKNKIFSIKSNLILWILIPLLFFTLIISILIYSVVKNSVNDFFDKRLYAIGKSIKEDMGIKDEKIYLDFANFSIDFLSTNEKGLIYYSIVDDKDNLLFGYEKLFHRNILSKKDKLFYNTVYNNSNLRVISFKTSFISKGKNYYAFITVGETSDERDKYLNKTIELLLLFMSIVIISSVSITLFAVKKGLTPLYKLKKIIKKRDNRDLKPLIFNAPKELEDAVKSINILLKRSRDTIEYIEQFNSDVSHQLRTPLAEMKMKLEIYQKKDKNYYELDKLLSNMIHITEQLLLYTKTNPNTINLTRFKKVCLNEVCKDYALKTVSRIYKKGFEFSFENLEKKVFINCDAILLESMLDNIIDNALHYAVDSKNCPIGTIYLSLIEDKKYIYLNIKDEGYGIKEDKLKDIFKRYYRVDENKEGTGLGLSIVKQIAFLHNAQVKASNENGLKISIRFKKIES